MPINLQIAYYNSFMVSEYQPLRHKQLFSIEHFRKQSYNAVLGQVDLVWLSFYTHQTQILKLSLTNYVNIRLCYGYDML